jgi:hypothetical protein
MEKNKERRSSCFDSMRERDQSIIARIKFVEQRHLLIVFRNATLGDGKTQFRVCQSLVYYSLLINPSRATRVSNNIRVLAYPCSLTDFLSLTPVATLPAES